MPQKISLALKIEGRSLQRERYRVATLQVLRKITFFDIFDANATISFNWRHERNNDMVRTITDDLGKKIT
jgi:hypothetical protein